MVQVCRRNVPIAEIRRIEPEPTEDRPIGVALARYGPWRLPSAFDDPLPEAIQAAFEGRHP